MLKINKKKLNETKWFKYEGQVEFELRLPKFSDMLISTSDNEEIAVNVSETIKNQFVGCIVSWKNITEEDGEEFVCNRENKVLLYDYEDGVREFVLSKLASMQK